MVTSTWILTFLMDPDATRPEHFAPVARIPATGLGIIEEVLAP